MPPLGMVDGMRSVDNSFFCPGQGCWLASSGMLFLGSNTSWWGRDAPGCWAAGPSIRWLYTLKMPVVRCDSGTGHPDVGLTASVSVSLLAVLPIFHGGSALRNAKRVKISSPKKVCGVTAFFLKRCAQLCRACTNCKHKYRRAVPTAARALRGVSSNQGVCCLHSKHSF